MRKTANNDFQMGRTLSDAKKRFPQSHNGAGGYFLGFQTLLNPHLHRQNHHQSRPLIPRQLQTHPRRHPLQEG